MVHIKSALEPQGFFAVIVENFQNEQIVDALKNLMENDKINKVELLRHLERINQNGIPQKFEFEIDDY